MSEIMRPTVFGSKFLSFDEGSTMDDRVLPVDGSDSYIKRDGYVIPITILQIQGIVYNNKIRYLIEYIERE